MKSMTSRLILFVFFRLFLCATATVLIAVVLERGSIFVAGVAKWLFIFAFAFAVCLYISLSVIQLVRETTKQSVKKFSDEVVAACAKTSENLLLIPEVLDKNAFLMDKFVFMINERDVGSNDVSK